MIAKRDAPKRFEFFCIRQLSAPTLSRPGGEDMFKLVGVRGFGLWQSFVPRFPPVVEFSDFSVLLTHD